MKKSKKTIVGAIIIGVGVVGLLGIFQNEDKLALAFGSFAIIVAGVVVLLLGLKANKTESVPEVQPPVQPISTPAQPAQSIPQPVEPIPTPIQPAQPISQPTQPFRQVQTLQSSTSKDDYDLQLNADEVIRQYITTSHDSCPNPDRFREYKRAEFSCMLKSLSFVPADVDEMITRKRHITEDIGYYSRSLLKDAQLKDFKDFIVIDTETTGFKPETNRIIEIAAIKFIDFKPVEIFHTYLDPKRKIPSQIEEVTGISDFMVTGCPTFPQIQESFEGFIRGYNLVMHNAKFDVSFLYHRGCWIDCLKQPIYDTLTLAKKYLHDSDGEKYSSYKLEEICWHYNIFPINAHGADSDALATGLLFNEILKIRFKTSNLEMPNLPE